jgi:hypothetical protein
MTLVEAIARKHNMSGLMLTVFKHNPRALSFYLDKLRCPAKPQSMPCAPYQQKPTILRQVSAVRQGARCPLLVIQPYLPPFSCLFAGTMSTRRARVSAAPPTPHTKSSPSAGARRRLLEFL